MKRNVLLLPLLIFLLIAAALLWQLARNAQGDDPTALESALTGKPVPAFRLESLDRPGQYYEARALNRRGGELLRWLVRSEHADIRVLSLYAFNAFDQQRFGEAVAAWEMMLKLLPADDSRRAVIERSIKQALAQEK